MSRMNGKKTHTHTHTHYTILYYILYYTIQYSPPLLRLLEHWFFVYFFRSRLKTFIGLVVFFASPSNPYPKPLSSFKEKSERPRPSEHLPVEGEKISSSHSIYSGRQTCGRTSRGHTGCFHFPSAVLAFIFIAKRKKIPVRVTAPRFELTSQRQKVSSLPTESPGRPAYSRQC